MSQVASTGIGKSALVSLLGKQLAPQFDAVLWRSVRDAPSCEDLVANCLTFFSETPPAEFPPLLEQRINQLIGRLQERRCLLVLDNLETLLEVEDPEGNYRPGYQGYGRLIERLGESAHRSCVVLTSREKPREIEAMEGLRGPVRSLRLLGLSEEAARSLLEDKDLRGESSAWLQLIATYAGNPLALKIVGQAIVDLFAGEIVPFLQSGELIFNGIRVVLRQQVARLTLLEQMLLTWLAVVRGWTSLDSLLSLLVPRSTRGRVLEALEALSRRSLIERGQGASFTLQAVVMEYVTDALLDQLTGEIVTQAMDHLRRYALEQAQAKDYVREIQVRLLVRPLVELLRAELASDSRIEDQLLALLMHFRTEDDNRQGYGPANVISLLKALRSDLRGLDLSRLAIRGAYLQGVEMQDANLSGALMRECVLSEAFYTITAVAISRSGQYWAATSRRGEVRVWREEGKLLHLAWQAHSDMTLALALSPNEHTLASGGWDGSVKLWEVASGALLWSGWQTKGTICLAFSPDGRLLASGDFAGTTRLWEMQQTGPARLWQTLSGHTNLVRGLAFAPDGSRLASASWDSTVKLWQLASGRCLQTLVGHTERVEALAWSPDGTQLVSGGTDQLVTIWDVAGGKPPRVLHGHRWRVHDVGWSPDGSRLASSEWDSAIRIWDPTTGTCVQILRDLDHPDTNYFGVSWSPDGQLLACCTYLHGVQVWNVTTRSQRWVSRQLPTWIRRVAWSPDGTRLVGGGDDGHVYVWDASDGTQLERLAEHQGAVTSVAWSPDGTRLASAGSGRESGKLFVWDAHSGERAQTLVGQSGMVCAVAWGPSGELLISGGGDGTLRWWEVQSGECVRVREAHQGTVQALKVSPDGSILASCGDDGAIRLWDLEGGEPLQTLRRDRLYERLNITGIRGLAEAQKAALRALGGFEETSADR